MLDESALLGQPPLHDLAPGSLHQLLRQLHRLCSLRHQVQESLPQGSGEHEDQGEHAQTTTKVRSHSKKSSENLQFI